MYEKVLKASDIVWFLRRQWSQSIGRLHNTSFTVTGVIHVLLLFSRMARCRAPNDSFLPNALKICFRLSRLLLKFCICFLSGTIKFLSVRSS